MKPYPKAPEYLVSEDGQLFSTKTNKYLSNNSLRQGYIVNRLTINNEVKTLERHRIVAETYLDNPENKPIVDHIDENKTNNNINNLQWVTQEENMNKGTIAQRTREKRGKTITAINPTTMQIEYIFNSIAEAADFLEISPSCISRALIIPLATCSSYYWI